MLGIKNKNKTNYIAIKKILHSVKRLHFTIMFIGEDKNSAHLFLG